MTGETQDPRDFRPRPAWGEAGYSAAARISTNMVQLMSRYTGRGPTTARTTLNTNSATVILNDTLTKAERNLVAAGESESVIQQRRTFHRLLREEAVSAVEEATGRRVRAYLADVAPDVGVGAHVFVFEEQPETGQAFFAEARDET